MGDAHALRLTFAYRDGQIRLLGSERIATIAPAPVTPPPDAGQTGYWFGVLDAAGRVLYHRPLHDPLRVDVEVFSPDPRASITRAPAPQAAIEFTLLVPDTADAQAFTLQGPADPARSDRAATELLRLDMDVLRKTPPPVRTGRTP